MDNINSNVRNFADSFALLNNEDKIAALKILVEYIDTNYSTKPLKKSLDLSSVTSNNTDKCPYCGK